MGEIVKRALKEEEIKALQTQFYGLDLENLVFVQDPNDDVHTLGKIIREKAEDEVKPASAEETGPNLAEEEVADHVVVCSLLWLARQDAKAAGFLKDSYTEEDYKLPDNVTVLEDNLALDHLSHLRNEKTSLRNFRFHSDELSLPLFRKAVADLAMYEDKVSNQLVREVGAATTPVPKLAERVVVAPVLRAGLALLAPAMQALPKSKIATLGMRRLENGEPEWYYENVPTITKDSVVVITDPMLATGGTLIEAIRKINSGPVKPKEIRIVAVVAAPEGITAINREFDNIKIFTAAVDSHLNSSLYIVPGLGDYGDRYFGTEPAHSIT
ncbi:MAG: Uracil phosphoribosyltransferase [Candidatus Pacebacteria bacterium GW2011_GWB1_47_8]|nr:MAG: Uracil phosphoribosyltransferase [Candidatus Pacebacteria bacterium GW2011_GWA1_46_10]KKU84154.1 MAG: Uracil phosphoribosyltransferase [Candidatus Pacebacteria bacterium GW2011_GWB1_47_8]HCR80887.1 uracil phosphoribosyltransferase [Candidatus Paceibacterota bacterium]